jgi:hypothetical protein
MITPVLEARRCIGKNRTHRIKTLLDKRQLNQHQSGLPAR